MLLLPLGSGYVSTATATHYCVGAHADAILLQMTDVEVCALGGHGFLLCFIVTCGMQLSFFAVAYGCSFDKVTDFAGGMNFTVLAILTLVNGGSMTTRQWVTTLLVCVSRTQLALLLLHRVLKRGHDARFDEMRAHFFAFLGFWIFQIMWVYVVSTPLIYLNCERAYKPALGVTDYIGWILTALGFVLQVFADLQKMRFRNNKENRGRVCDAGLWSVTRHPNYFGEMLIWWGVFVSASAVFGAHRTRIGYATIVSPVFTMLILLFLSGMPTAEGKALKRFYTTEESSQRFGRYFRRTPPIVPFVPQWYEAMPLVLKRIFCCEFKMYEYRNTQVDFASQENELSESPSGSSASKDVLLENGHASAAVLSSSAD